MPSLHPICPTDGILPLHLPPYYLPPITARTANPCYAIYSLLVFPYSPFEETEEPFQTPTSFLALPACCHEKEAPTLLSPASPLLEIRYNPVTQSYGILAVINVA
jgi:hypothetical protein